MNVIVLIVVGALTGWLTGKAVEVEGRTIVGEESHVTDAVYGIIGALIGNIYFSGSLSVKAMPLAVMQLPFLARSLSWEPLGC